MPQGKRGRPVSVHSPAGLSARGTRPSSRSGPLAWRNRRGLRGPPRQRAAFVFPAANKPLALYEALLARTALDDEEKQRILEHEDVLVPLLVK